MVHIEPPPASMMRVQSVSLEEAKRWWLVAMIVGPILSGVAGAMATVFGKLAGADVHEPYTNLPYWCLCFVATKLTDGSLDAHTLCSNAELWKHTNAGDRLPSASLYITMVHALRIVFFAMVFVSNGLMWKLFTSALAESKSSIQVTVVNSGANLCATALLGNFLFSEPLPLKWWAGATLVVAGTVLVSQGQSSESSIEKSSEKKD
ncbi:hypothetical protein BJ742DRAFT_284946 [Cladochytrium replicatum]|nr:hypothetical protein BJ742DRAFT_284946 [Cladochytrium replicatum]